MAQIFKYLVYPGYVTSKKDGDRHFINCKKLCELYKVSMSECRFIYHAIDCAGIRGKFKELRPDSSGEYNLGKCVEVEL